MKITILGSVVTIVAEGLPFKSLKENFPQGVNIQNQEGKTVFLASANGTGALNQYGAKFNQENAEGEALIQLPYDGKKKEFIATYADGLAALEQHLPEVTKKVTEREKFLADTEAKIVVE